MIVMTISTRGAPLNKKNGKSHELSRIGVAIDTELLDQFDRLIKKRGYESRSEAFRDLIRADLVYEAVCSPNSLVVGSLTLLYDHHVRLLSDRLTEVQHQAHHMIRSTLPWKTNPGQLLILIDLGI